MLFVLDDPQKKLRRSAYSDVITLFLVSRIVFAVLILMSQTTLSEFKVVCDSEHYVRIAQDGYEDPLLTVFFPMIPMLIRFLSWYGLVAVNQVCLFVSMILLKRLLEDRYKSDVVNQILFIFAFSPISYFSFAAYTECVFFVLTLSSFYLFVKNKHPWLMGIFLGLSVATRNTGSIFFFALFIGMVIRWIKKENTIIHIIQAYVPATMISLIYPVFLQVRHGNWKMFVDYEYSNWFRIHSNFFKTTFISLKMIFTNEYEYDGASLTLFRINETLTLLLTASLIILSIRAIRKIKECDAVPIVTVLIPIMSIIIFTSSILDPNIHAPTRCFFRYYYALVPTYILLHDMKPKFMNVLMIVSIFLSCFMSILFFKGQFFY